MSDLSLLWLPSGKYDSVKPLWQEGYIWNPLPVDNTLPLHQTSFLDIDEKEAASVARSRATTLRSRASTQTLPRGMRRRTVSHRSGQEEADQSELDTASPLDGGSARERRVFRTGPTKPMRLHSFRLGDALQREPGAEAVVPTATRRRRTPRADAQISLDQQAVAGGQRNRETPPVGKSEAGVDTQVVRTSKSVSRRQRNGAGRRNSAAQSLGGDTQDKAEADLPVIREQPTRQPPIRIGSQTVMGQTGEGSQCIGVKLDINLEIEVQLKVKLQGDLTLTLFN